MNQGVKELSLFFITLGTIFTIWVLYYPSGIGSDIYYYEKNKDINLYKNNYNILPEDKPYYNLAKILEKSSSYPYEHFPDFVNITKIIYKDYDPTKNHKIFGSELSKRGIYPINPTLYANVVFSKNDEYFLSVFSKVEYENAPNVMGADIGGAIFKLSEKGRWDLIASNPNILSIGSMGRTWEEENLDVVKISNNDFAFTFSETYLIQDHEATFVKFIVLQDQKIKDVGHVFTKSEYRPDDCPPDSKRCHSYVADLLVLKNNKSKFHDILIKKQGTEYDSKNNKVVKAKNELYFFESGTLNLKQKIIGNEEESNDDVSKKGIQIYLPSKIEHAFSQIRDQERMQAKINYNSKLREYSIKAKQDFDTKFFFEKMFVQNWYGQKLREKALPFVVFATLIILIANIKWIFFEINDIFESLINSIAKFFNDCFVAIKNSAINIVMKTVSDYDNRIIITVTIGWILFCQFLYFMEYGRYWYDDDMKVLLLNIAPPAIFLILMKLKRWAIKAKEETQEQESRGEP